MVISGYGLREGLLYRQMPEAMRMQDPLIEACRHMEAASARSPGFGEALYALAEAALRRRAGVRASADPGRVPAARRELAGASRLPRGALLRVGDTGQHRRRGPSRAGVPGAGVAQPLQGHRPGGGAAPLRLDADRRSGPAEAAVLGRAMRLGAMLSGSATGVLDHASDRPEGRTAGADAARAGARVRRRGGRAAAADACAGGSTPQARCCWWTETSSTGTAGRTM